MAKKKPDKEPEKTPHEKLVQTAKEAIRAVHSDTSVDPDQTMESLEELHADISGMIAAAEEDLENEDDEDDVDFDDDLED